MVSDLISSIIYMELSEELGPVTKSYLPRSLPENHQMLVSVKTITLLAGEEAFIPKELIIIPFPSINMKCLVKYIQWEDNERRGNIGSAAIAMLFKEANDAVFYKYIKDFEGLYNEYGKKFADLELKKAESSEFSNLLEVFQAKFIDLLDQLREKELKEEDAFPEATTKNKDLKTFIFKIIVCGDPSVGKTSSILRFTHNAFKRTYMPTIGVNITEKEILLNGSMIKLVLWDIAGQQKFETMRSHFYQGAEGMLLIYDVTQFKTFNSIYSWHKDIQKNIKREVHAGVVIANKCDLQDSREINRIDGKKLADELGLLYYETSALTGENINEAFHKIAEAILKNKGVL